MVLHRGVLHRVDADQLPAGAGVSLGALCTQSTAPKPIHSAPQPQAAEPERCAPGTGCMGHPACADMHCSGHRLNTGNTEGGSYASYTKQAHMADALATGLLWVLVAVTVGLVAAVAWLLASVQWVWA